MSRILVIAALGLGFFPGAGSAEEAGQARPRFVESDGECLRLESADVTYSALALAEAQYDWLRANYPGYEPKVHMKPKPVYLKKLGCETGRGSILRIETGDGKERSVCFCLPVTRPSDAMPPARAPGDAPGTR